MSQPPTTPRIDELRARLIGDPRSRHFYPLAEELRKIGRLDEAQETLINGLAANPTYLSAWVSLGRVLTEMGKLHGAVDALNKALTFDPGNVVAARLLADAYLGLGEKVEAIKKFKLVNALMPSDLEVVDVIQSLEDELRGTTEEMVVAEPEVLLPSGTPSVDRVIPFQSEAESYAEPVNEVFASPQAANLSTESLREEGFEPTIELIIPALVPPIADEDDYVSFLDRPITQTVELSTESLAQSETVEEPSDSPEQEEQPGEPQDQNSHPLRDLTATITMAELYAQQGHIESARAVFRQILEADPGNEEVLLRLSTLPGDGIMVPESLGSLRDEKVRRLRLWMQSVSRREAIR